MKTVLSFVSSPSRCEYLHDRTWQLQYQIVATLTADEYQTHLNGGWRRFGHSMFRPACPSCRMCQSLRVPVATFRADRSQRRAWQANQDLRLDVGEPSRSAAKEALRARFQTFQHVHKGWPEESADYDEMFVDNPFPTEEWRYWLGDRLVGVGYVDRVPEGLSAIYFYYDPDERQRSLGTFNILSVLSSARERGLPYVYLGYYVEGCQSLDYKAHFCPNEVLRPTGDWAPFRVKRSASAAPSKTTGAR